jgi:hypothetical protein
MGAFAAVAVVPGPGFDGIAAAVYLLFAATPRRIFPFRKEREDKI